MSLTTQARGSFYETLAAQFLQKKGYKLVTRNFRSPFGEIDLIMRGHDTLVFVEVRYRKNQNYGLPVQTVTPAKQKKITKTAKLYLSKQGLYDKVCCRFDVIGIALVDEKPTYHWIPNAFYQAS